MTKMPRQKTTAILQVIPAMRGGGVERGTVEVAAALTQVGAKAYVVSSGGGMVHELERAGAVHITLPVASKNPFVMWRNAARLARLIRKLNISLVHVRSRAPAWSCVRACRKTGVPLVTTFHAAYKVQNRFKRTYNAVMAKGKRVIAISHFISHYIQENYAIDPNIIRVVPRGVDLAKFSPEMVSAERMVAMSRQWRLPDDCQIVLMPARLTRIKGHEVLLKAMARLPRKDVCCVMVGGDNSRSAYRTELLALIEKLDLVGRVYLVDHCSDMATAYQMASVVVVPSLVPEGFGRVPVEAQAMGRPVIASGIGGCAETIEAGETGWLVPPNDDEALAFALDEALSLDADERSALGFAARKHIEAHYALDRMLDGTLAVYEEVLS